MRSKKAFINTMMQLFYQMVAVISGLILPRLILVHFGSDQNGLVSSINQFISFAVLLRAGIGGVTRAALYKPLADTDIDTVSGIINATKQFMRRVTMVLVIYLVILSMIFPIIVCDNFDLFFTFSLVWILSISTVVQNYFAIPYQILIEADQRKYIYTLLEASSTIINLMIAGLLIYLGASLHIVKLFSGLVFACNPLLLSLYVKKHYHLNTRIEANTAAIHSRWDAFAMQFSTFINQNTDIVILTLFTTMSEVSVYSVYNMICLAVYNLINALCVGMGAAFGNILAKEEYDLLDKNFKLLEFLVFSVAAVLFTCSAILIIPFIKIYTFGVTDANYIRPLFAAIMVLNYFLFSIRIPYQMIVEAAGKYRETRNGAIIECILNIIISIIAVQYGGIIGVVIGTFVASLFRTFQYSLYSSKVILCRKYSIVIGNFCFSLLLSVSILFAFRMIKGYIFAANSYFEWIISALIIVGISFVIFMLISFLLKKNEMKDTYKIIKRIFNKRRFK